MVNFKDGKLVKDAYVEINGVEKKVHMPQYSGETPVNSENLNKLQIDLQKGIDANTNKNNNLQNQVNGLASGSPLVASSTSEMTDTTRVYVNTSDGHWYYYNGSTWADGGVYQATEDPEVKDVRTGFNGVTYDTAGNSVREQANLINQTKETLMPLLFTKDTINWITDKRVNNKGDIIEAPGFQITEPVPIQNNYLLFDYVYQFGTKLDFSYFINFYNSDVINANNLVGFANPENALILTKCYANMSKFDVPKNATHYVICVVTNSLTELNIYQTKINTNFINENSIDDNKLKNIFKQENILSGNLTSETIGLDGTTRTSETYKLTDFLSVEEETRYYRYKFNSIALIGCFDENKNWISRVDCNNLSSFITPANCKFIRYCDSNENMENQVIGKYKVNKSIPYNTFNSLNIDDSELANEILNKVGRNKLKNKKICVLGDSISYGAGASDRNKTSWVALLQENTGAIVTNLAISGASLQYRQGAESEAKSIYTISTETDFTEYDYVIISAGTNDILANIGTPESRENTNACGALNLIIENIMTSNPKCQILFFRSYV